MKRRSLFGALLAVPFASVAALKAAVQKPKPSELVVRIQCDTSELVAALERARAHMETWNAAPNWEEVRAHMDGMPPISVKVDGKEIDRIYLAI